MVQYGKKISNGNDPGLVCYFQKIWRLLSSIFLHDKMKKKKLQTKAYFSCMRAPPYIYAPPPSYGLRTQLEI